MLNLIQMSPRTAHIAGELAALYNDDPKAHRIDPFALAAIEDAGGTFNFQTGEVSFDTPQRRLPIVGVVDSATGIVHWHNAKGA